MITIVTVTNGYLAFYS